MFQYVLALKFCGLYHKRLKQFTGRKYKSKHAPDESNGVLCWYLSHTHTHIYIYMYICMFIFQYGAYDVFGNSLWNDTHWLSHFAIEVPRGLTGSHVCPNLSWDPIYICEYWFDFVCVSTKSLSTRIRIISSIENHSIRTMAQKTLVNIPINCTVNWPWPSAWNLTLSPLESAIRVGVIRCNLF